MLIFPSWEMNGERQTSICCTMRCAAGGVTCGHLEFSPRFQIREEGPGPRAEIEPDPSWSWAHYRLVRIREGHRTRCDSSFAALFFRVFHSVNRVTKRWWINRLFNLSVAPENCNESASERRWEYRRYLPYSRLYVNCYFIYLFFHFTTKKGLNDSPVLNFHSDRLRALAPRQRRYRDHSSTLDFANRSILPLTKRIWHESFFTLADFRNRPDPTPRCLTRRFDVWNTSLEFRSKSI